MASAETPQQQEVLKQGKDLISEIDKLESSLKKYNSEVLKKKSSPADLKEIFLSIAEETQSFLNKNGPQINALKKNLANIGENNPEITKLKDNLNKILNAKIADLNSLINNGSITKSILGMSATIEFPKDGIPSKELSEIRDSLQRYKVN